MVTSKWLTREFLAPNGRAFLTPLWFSVLNALWSLLMTKPFPPLVTGLSPVSRPMRSKNVLLHVIVIVLLVMVLSVLSANLAIIYLMNTPVVLTVVQLRVVNFVIIILVVPNVPLVTSRHSKAVSILAQTPTTVWNLPTIARSVIPMAVTSVRRVILRLMRINPVCVVQSLRAVLEFVMIFLVVHNVWQDMFLVMLGELFSV